MVPSDTNPIEFYKFLAFLKAVRVRSRPPPIKWHPHMERTTSTGSSCARCGRPDARRKAP